LRGACSRLLSALGTTVATGGATGCPEVSTRPNGVGVIAYEQSDENYEAPDPFVALVREPGGAWDAPVKLSELKDTRRENLQVAVADTGDAVVAWSEQDGDDDRSQLYVARRAPGPPFGAPELIGGPRERPGALRVGVAAMGETVVMSGSVESGTPPLRVPVRVAVAGRGAAFLATRRARDGQLALDPGAGRRRRRARAGRDPRRDAAACGRAGPG